MIMRINGNKEVVALLLEKGADVKVKDFCSHNVYFYADICKNHQIARILLEKELEVSLNSTSFSFF